MLDFGDEEIGGRIDACEVTCGSVEGIGHAERLQVVIQSSFILHPKFWHSDDDIDACESIHVLVPGRCCQCFDKCVDRHTLGWQQQGHAVYFLAVWKLQHLSTVNVAAKNL